MKKRYDAIKIAVVGFKLEQGFALSMVEPLRLSNPDSESSEERAESGNWSLSDDESFWNNSF